jgi:hypothetical protein
MWPCGSSPARKPLRSGTAFSMGCVLRESATVVLRESVNRSHVDVTDRRVLRPSRQDLLQNRCHPRFCKNSTPQARQETWPRGRFISETAENPMLYFGLNILIKSASNAAASSYCSKRQTCRISSGFIGSAFPMILWLKTLLRPMPVQPTYKYESARFQAYTDVLLSAPDSRRMSIAVNS